MKKNFASVPIGEDEIDGSFKDPQIISSSFGGILA
jgi:hypothetical protein